MADQSKRLYRTRADRMVFGVLGGLAEYFKIDPSWVRIGFVLLTIITGFFPGFVLYFLVTIIVPPNGVLDRDEGT